jgi:hypothetical protein
VKRTFDVLDILLCMFITRIKNSCCGKTDLDSLISLAVIIILLFVDGLIFGVAAAKGILSIILIVLGLILASMIGLAIPFLSLSAIMTHISNIISSQASYFSYYFLGFPLSWIIGFIVGAIAF